MTTQTQSSMSDNLPANPDYIAGFGKRVLIRACRALGWQGDEARTDKDTLVQWLHRKGLTVGAFKAATLGRDEGATPHQPAEGDNSQQGTEGSAQGDGADGAQGEGSGNSQPAQGDAQQQQQDASQQQQDAAEAAQDEAEAAADASAAAEREQRKAQGSTTPQDKRDELEAALRALDRQQRAEQRAERQQQRQQRRAERERQQEQEAERKRAEQQRQQEQRQQEQGDEGDESEGDEDAPQSAQGDADEDGQGEAQQDAPRPPKGAIRHPMYGKVLSLVKAGMNVLLVGPAGTGKTTIAHHVADDLKRDFGAVHCTAGMSESHVMGYLLPLGEGGKFVYKAAPFGKLYGEGNSVFLFDEMDAADSNMLLVVNGALANGSLHIPQNPDSPVIKRGVNAAVMAACNTYGGGSDYVYAGRAPLDAATLDRFYAVWIDYDLRFEASIVGAEFKGSAKSKKWRAAGLTAEQVNAETILYMRWVHEVRASVERLGLHRVVSTRWIQKGKAALEAGLSPAEIRADMLASWTADERKRVTDSLSAEVK